MDHQQQLLVPGHRMLKPSVLSRRKINDSPSERCVFLFSLQFTQMIQTAQLLTIKDESLEDTLARAPKSMS